MFGDDLGVQVGGAMGREADIDGAAGDPFADLALGSFQQRDFDSWVPAPECAQALWQQPCCRAGDAVDAKRALVEPCPTGTVLVDALDGAQRSSGAGQHAQPDLGRRNALPPTRDNRDTDSVLQCADGLAGGRLRHAKTFRRGGEAALVHHGDEQA